MSTKSCNICHKELPLDQFHKDKAREDGYKAMCKACRKAPERKASKKKSTKKAEARLHSDGFEMVSGYRITKKDTPAGTRYVVNLGIVDGKHLRPRFEREQDARNMATNSRLKVKKSGEEVLAFTENHRKDAFKALAIAKEFKCTLEDMALFYERHHTPAITDKKTSELIDRYLAHKAQEVERGNIRPTSYESASHFMKNLREAIGEMDIESISYEDLNRFLDGIKGLPNKKGHRTYMKAFFNWVETHTDNFKKRKNPVKRVTKVTMPHEDPEAYAVEDAVKLMSNAPEKLVPFLTLGFFCGLRTTECLRLRWEQVKFEDGRIALPGVLTKKNRTRYINLEPNAAYLLKQYKQEGGLVVPTGCDKLGSGSRKVQRWMRVLAKAQGVELIHSGCRHSFATYHLAKYDNIDATRKAMGHTGFNILESSYADYSKAFKKDAERYFSIGLPQSKVIPLTKTA